MKIPRPRLWYAAITALVFGFIDQFNAFLKLIGWRRFTSEWLYVLGIRNTFEVITCFLAVLITHRLGFKRAARELGIAKPVGRGLAFAAIATLPMLIAFALTSNVNPNMTFLSVGVLCIIAPFAEEVLFRGFIFRQLYQRARLGFWLSALLPSIVFASKHLYQSDDMMELLGIVAITGTGGIGFCWFFMKWRYNIWAIFGLHSLMNLWWEVFAVDDTALGGWLANGARLATVIIAVLLTIYRDKIWKPLPSEADDIDTKPADSTTPDRPAAPRVQPGYEIA
jgi:membrane protease YdiL (CAAX protease family)